MYPEKPPYHSHPPSPRVLGAPAVYLDRLVTVLAACRWIHGAPRGEKRLSFPLLSSPERQPGARPLHPFSLPPEPYTARSAISSCQAGRAVYGEAWLRICRPVTSQQHDNASAPGPRRRPLCVGRRLWRDEGQQGGTPSRAGTSERVSPYVSQAL